MDTKLLEAGLSHYSSSLSDSFKSALRQEVTYLSLPKSHFLLEAPRPAEFIYLIQAGFAVGFLFDEGQRKIHSFWGAGDIILNPQGCFERSSSIEFVQLVEPSDVWCLSRNSFRQLLETYSDAQLLYRIVLGRYYTSLRSRLYDVQHRTAWHRFQKLVQQFPNLEQKVSQEFIASFLGITPQSLSRMKREHRGDS
ncbi:MAG TPA: Crp/Fnr family transcriptional regulator [Cyclobacteriaceae bacterium]|nr:Crp/Fnr family transcriptional regulator [Cyclobacteriaceae bacterium]